jgi:hypothetical protein
MPQVNEYMLEVDVVQENVIDSPYYEAIDNETASINFCVRVNYNYYDGQIIQEITYHESIVSVMVDLTKGFQFLDLDTERIEAHQTVEGASLDYPIDSYFCNDANQQVAQPTLSQGDSVQICCRIQPGKDDSLVFLADIWTLTVNQVLEGEYFAAVINTEPAAWTQKQCSGGICNIKTMIPSKFFARQTPGPLIITGTALLALGLQSNDRYLRAREQRNVWIHQRQLEPSGIRQPAVEQMQKFSVGVSLRSNVEGQLRKFQTSLGVSVLILLVCLAALVFTGVKLRNLVSQTPEVMIPLSAFMSALKNEVEFAFYADPDPETKEVTLEKDREGGGDFDKQIYEHTEDDTTTAMTSVVSTHSDIYVTHANDSSEITIPVATCTEIERESEEVYAIHPDEGTKDDEVLCFSTNDEVLYFGTSDHQFNQDRTHDTELGEADYQATGDGVGDEIIVMEEFETEHEPDDTNRARIAPYIRVNKKQGHVVEDVSVYSFD